MRDEEYEPTAAETAEDDGYETVIQNHVDGGPEHETIIVKDACWMCHGSAFIANHVPCLYCAGKGYQLSDKPDLFK